MVKLKKIRSYMTEFEAEQGKNLLAASGIETDWALRVRAAGENLDIDDLLTLLAAWSSG